MKRNIYLIVGVLMLSYFNTLHAQKNKVNPFQMVRVPDSIYLKLEESYKNSTGFDNVNAGRNVRNLIDLKDFVFANGLYSFKGQGPDFPRQIFLYNNAKLYIFTSNYINEVLKEYQESIVLLNISERDRIKYLKAICNYLQEEFDDR